jgi:transposase
MKPAAITDEQAEAALDKLREGMMLAEIAREFGVKRTTLLAKLNSTPEWSDAYARAREDGLDTRAEELEMLASEPLPSTATGGIDSAAVAQLRLRIDARKWILGKMLAYKYGEKITQEHTGPNGGPLEITQITRKVVDPKA